MSENKKNDVDANGYTNPAGLPDFIVEVGAINGGGVRQTNLAIAASGSGTVKFSWKYDTQEGNALWDPFGYLLNGVFYAAYS